MSIEMLKYSDVDEKIITIRGEKVILDSDVAALYGVETNDVSQAVKRNLDKFPEGYIIGLTESEKKEVATNCGNPKIKFSPTLPNAFSEKRNTLGSGYKRVANHRHRNKF